MSDGFRRLSAVRNSPAVVAAENPNAGQSQEASRIATPRSATSTPIPNRPNSSRLSGKESPEEISAEDGEAPKAARKRTSVVAPSDGIGTDKKVERRDCVIAHDDDIPGRDPMARAQKHDQRSCKNIASVSQTKNLVPMATGVQLKGIANTLEQEIPKSMSEIRVARVRFPKSNTDLVLKRGATMTQAATYVALKVLERWVVVLIPLAPSSSGMLADLLSQIVHVRDDGHWQEPDGRFLEVLPPANTSLGAAIRRVVPKPDTPELQEWEWLEGVLAALEYQESFDPTSFVHRSSTPMSARSGSSRSGTPGTTMRPNSGTLVPIGERPKTTGQIPTRRPKSQQNARRRNDFARSGFQKNIGFRKTTTGACSDKYLRSVPGPALYSDYQKHIGLPQTAPTGVFPPVGDRRTPCNMTSLHQIDRFFETNFPRPQ